MSPQSKMEPVASVHRVDAGTGRPRPERRRRSGAGTANAT
ncbi:MAG: hypothetical protein QOF48_1370, partial [Verrucomicrobiota bacterium]